MSDPSTPHDDPFDHVPPDEVAELDALARALRHARGFTLLFVTCNRRDLRDRLITDLRSRLAPARILSISSAGPIVSLLDVLRQRLESPPPDAIFLLDLETWLPSGKEAETSPFVFNLNASRNYFPRDVPCPLVFWVPQHILTTLARGAPDFCSVRSGLFAFCATPQARDRIVAELTGPDMPEMAGLDLEEKHRRLDSLRSLLLEHEALPPELRDPRAESRLRNSLATLHQVMGHYENALTLFRRALEVDEADLGPDHPIIATRLNNLALLLKNTGRYDEAEPRYRRALASYERAYGPDHPEVAIGLNNLASLLRETGSRDEAETLYRRALAIDERAYGPDHPAVARNLNNLATLLQETRRHAEAEPLLRRALAIDERAYGPDHPEVATDLNNLAWQLRETGRNAEAEPLYLRALAIAEQAFGPNHPNVAKILESYAALLRALNRDGEAESIKDRAKIIRAAIRDEDG